MYWLEFPFIGRHPLAGDQDSLRQTLELGDDAKFMLLRCFPCFSRMYVCMYVCMYACMYGWMDVWMDVWMYGCMDVWMYVWMYVCMHVCM